MTPPAGSPLAIAIINIQTYSVNTSLTGRLVFFDGVLRPEKGVNIDLTDAYIDADPYTMIFDTSLGGTFSGSILNAEASAGWFGADATGKTKSGAIINTAIAAQLTTDVWLPTGSYDATDATIDTKLALKGPIGLVGTRGKGQMSTINFTTDFGVGKCAVDGANIANYDCIKIQGPGNGDIPFGTRKVMMDLLAIGGVALGGTGAKLISREKIAFAGGNAGILFNTYDGWHEFNEIDFSDNFVSTNALQTGGDVTFNGRITSSGERLSAFFAPRNSQGYGANLRVLKEWYTRGMPWQAAMDIVDDPRMPAWTGQPVGLFNIGSEIVGLGGELMGNGFCCATLDSQVIVDLKFSKGGPNNGNTAYMCPTAPWNRTDGSVIAGSVIMDITDMGNQSNFNPGDSYVFVTQDKYFITAVTHLNARSKPSELKTGCVWMNQPQYSLFINYQPLPHQLTFADKATVATYTMNDHEIASPQYARFPQIVFENNAQGWTYGISGNVVTITLDAPSSGQTNALLSLYTPGC